MHKADITSPSTPLPLAVGQRVKLTFPPTDPWHDSVVEVVEVLGVDDDSADLLVLASNSDPASVGSPNTYYFTDLATGRVEVIGDEVAA